MVEEKDVIDQNVWWRIKDWTVSDKHLLMLKKSDCQIKRKELEKTDDVNLVFGPRQVGKTTLIKLMIDKLISKGLEPNSIAYFSCDALISNKRDEFRKVLDFLLERDVKYLFIDEITNVKDWGFEIKYFIDSGKFQKIKVFITGSPFGMSEYMPGRKLRYFYLMPLTFREFMISLSANINENTKKAFNLKENEPEELKSLSNLLSFNTFNLSDDFRKLSEHKHDIGSYSSIIQKLLNYYMVTGGFPSVINGFIKSRIERNNFYILDEVKTSKERLIYSLRKSGKNEGICMQLISSIKKRVSSRYSFTQLKETEIDLGKETIVNYVNHLRNIFVLKVLYAYDFGKMEVGWKKNKKIYLIDPFLYHEDKLTDTDSILSSSEYVSKIIESIVAINLSYTQEDFLNPAENFLFFWYNSHEIDFIIKNKELIAIESKYGTKGKINRLSQIKNYIVLTKNEWKLDDEELCIPVSIFLSLLKNKEPYL